MRLINKYETSMGANDTITEKKGAAGSEKVWACHKDYARNQYSSGPKNRVEARGERLEKQRAAYSKTLDFSAGALKFK